MKKVFINGKWDTRKHCHVSNLLVSDCRYDVLLCMPWHVENIIRIGYRDRTEKKQNDEVRLLRLNQLDERLAVSK